MKVRNWAASIITKKPENNTPDPSVKAVPEHGLDINLTVDQAESRVQQLDSHISDGERELERLDDKYDRLLDEAAQATGHKKEKKLRMAHDTRLEMERLDQRLEEAKDRLEAWRDLQELMIRSSDPGVDVDDEPVATLEELDFDKLRDEAEQANKDQAERKAEVEELRNEVEAALDRSVDRERYSRVREEAAAKSGARVLERDEELAEDFQQVKEEE